MKTCITCQKSFSLTEFYRYANGTYFALCKLCNRKRSNTWKSKNKERVRRVNTKYKSSEKGYINETINGIFTRFRKKNRRKKWIPECTKQEIYDELMLYIQDYGKICEYCEQAWTYGRHNKGIRGFIYAPSNFSIDRLDSEKTYTKDNLVFCCIGCNLRKNQVRLSDIDNIQKVRQRRGLK